MSVKCIRRSSLAPGSAGTRRLPDTVLCGKKVCPQAVEKFGCGCHGCAAPMTDEAAARSTYIPCCRVDPGTKKVICRSMDATLRCSCEACNVFIDADSPLVICCNRHHHHTLIKRTQMYAPPNEARIRGMT